MTRKLKLSFAFVVPVALGAISMSVAMAAAKNIHSAKADPVSYELTLDSSNAASGLSSSFQRRVESTVTTSRGSTLSFVYTTARALDGGLVELGNYGTVYCITNDDHHISGLSSVKVTFTGGSLTLKSSSVDSSDGASYVTDVNAVTSGTAVNLANGANSFVLEAAEAYVSITEIKLTYSCSAVATSYDFTKVYDVEDFESYTATGVGYDGSHNMATATNLRSQFYSVYYGAGSNPMSGAGWQVMGSSDYLTYHGTAGRNGSKTALFKSNASNYFEYIQAKHYFGVPTAIGKGAKLSAWIHGAYADTNGTAGAAAQVTLIAYYNRLLDKSGINDGASATYTINGSDGWAEYTVDLDPTKTVYGFGIHIAKAGATLYLPVDDVKIYTNSPYGTVAVESISLNASNANLIVGETKALTATVLPANATDKSVTWSSSNASVASVNANGLVTANAIGTAVITATTTDGGLTASCSVKVDQTYPGGTYFTTVTVSSYNIKIEVICSTRAECIVYFYGMKTDGARFTSYNPANGAFVIEIDGDANLGALGTYSYGTMTGNYVNDQLENVGLTGSIKNLLGSVNGTITVPHPSQYYWDCNGSTSDLQNTFRRRWRNNSAWAYDDSNTDRIEADTVNKTSGNNGVKIRPYASGVGLVLKNAVSGGIPLSTANTFCAWIYNPSTSAVNFRFFLYKNADLSSNFEPMSTKTIEAQSWYYLRIGYGSLSNADTVYNFMITNLGANSSVTFVVDDIWFHN